MSEKYIEKMCAKCLIVLPFESLAKGDVIKLLKKSFPELIDCLWQTTAFLGNELLELNEGDIVVLEDDTQYTVSSLAKICEKTQNPVIVLKEDSYTFVKVIVSEVLGVKR